MRTFVLGLGILTLGACGDDGVKHLADAPVVGGSDAAVDGPKPIDAAPQPVTLTITLDGSPVAGIPVYFQNPDSTEVATIMTDATGVASSMMPLGGYVTTVDPFPQPVPTAIGPNENHTLRTFAGVKGGDHLVLASGAAADAGQVVNLTVPTDAAAAEYDIYTDCGGNQNYIAGSVGSGSGALKLAAANAAGDPTSQFTLYGCGATANFLVISLDQSYAPLNYFEVANVAIAGTGGNPADVDLSTNSFAGITSITTNATNAPDAYTQGSLYMNFATAAGEIGTSDYSYTYDTYETFASGAYAFAVNAPAATAVRVDRLDLEGPNDQQQLYRWGAAAESDGSYKFDTTGLPLLGFAAAPTYDQPTNTISWTTVAGVTPDAYLLEYDGERDFLDGSGTSQGLAQWSWQIAGPAPAAGASASIVLPKLIGDAATFNTLATDNTYDGGTNDPISGITVAKVPGGYDLVRAHAFAVIDQIYDLSGLALTASGHFELDNYGYLGGGRGKRPMAKKTHVVTSPGKLLHDIQRIVGQTRR